MIGNHQSDLHVRLAHLGPLAGNIAQRAFKHMDVMVPGVHNFDGKLGNWGASMIQKEDGLMTPAYWELRAEEARTRADGMRDSAASDLMFRIARTYDAMAERVRTRRIFFTESTAQ